MLSVKAMFFHCMDYNDNFTIHKTILSKVQNPLLIFTLGKLTIKKAYINYTLDLTTRNEEKKSRNKENCT